MVQDRTPSSPLSDKEPSLLAQLKAIRDELLTQASKVSDVIRMIECAPELERAFHTLKKFS